MIILNFSHPLNDDQLSQIERLLGQAVGRVIEIRSQIDPQEPLAPQVDELVASAGLTPAEWASEGLLVNPPALNFSTAVLLAQLHGRLGHFPPCIRLRPVPHSPIPKFEVAEIINLQQLRTEARQQRTTA